MQLANCCSRVDDALRAWAHISLARPQTHFELHDKKDFLVVTNHLIRALALSRLLRYLQPHAFHFLFCVTLSPTVLCLTHLFSHILISLTSLSRADLRSLFHRYFTWSRPASYLGVFTPQSPTTSVHASDTRFPLDLFYGVPSSYWPDLHFDDAASSVTTLETLMALVGDYSERL